MSVPMPAASDFAPATTGCATSATLATVEPKSADSPVLESVQRRLRESSYYYLRSIHCAFEDGVLTLRGRVPTFYLKQTLQSLAERVEGVEVIRNLVDVVNPAGA